MCVCVCVLVQTVVLNACLDTGAHTCSMKYGGGQEAHSTDLDACSSRALEMNHVRKTEGAELNLLNAKWVVLWRKKVMELGVRTAALPPSVPAPRARRGPFPGSGVSGLPLEKQLGQLPGRWASPGPPLPAAAAQLLSAETCFWNKNWVSPLSGICPARETPDSGLHVLI